MYKELAPKQAHTQFGAELKVCYESIFGVLVTDKLFVTYTSAEQLRAKITSLLSLEGVNLVRWEVLEFRLNEKHELVQSNLYQQVQ